MSESLPELDPDERPTTIAELLNRVAEFLDLGDRLTEAASRRMGDSPPVIMGTEVQDDVRQLAAVLSEHPLFDALLYKQVYPDRAPAQPEVVSIGEWESSATHAAGCGLRRMCPSWGSATGDHWMSEDSPSCVLCTSTCTCEDIARGRLLEIAMRPNVLLRCSLQPNLHSYRYMPDPTPDSVVVTCPDCGSPQVIVPRTPEPSLASATCLECGHGLNWHGSTDGCEYLENDPDATGCECPLDGSPAQAPASDIHFRGWTPPARGDEARITAASGASGDTPDRVGVASVLHPDARNIVSLLKSIQLEVEREMDDGGYRMFKEYRKEVFVRFRDAMTNIENQRDEEKASLHHPFSVGDYVRVIGPGEFGVVVQLLPDEHANIWLTPTGQTVKLQLLSLEHVNALGEPLS